jgi:DNA-binding NarL/FixJ family response regulator
MSKQRPSSKTLSYWRKRVYRNSFSRAGQLHRLAHWSIKIQLDGVRKTISLNATSRRLAAIEAGRLYARVRKEGWAGAPRPRSAREKRVLPSYWENRLVCRPYLTASGHGESDLLVRIEQNREGWYFPLWTNDRSLAAKRATEIFALWRKEGWTAIQVSVPREISVAFFWSMNPVRWTYTTLLTRMELPDPNPRAESHSIAIGLISPNPEIAAGLAAHLRKMKRCGAIRFATNIPQAVRGGICDHSKVLLVDANLLEGASPSVKQKLGDACVVPFSVYADTDELFKSTPGGASAYFLKRTSPDRMLDPLFSGAARPLSVQGSSHEYFLTLLDDAASADPNHPVVRLTSREQEIVECLSRGCSDKEIAQILRISAWTVHNHLKHIFGKLNVHSRTEAAIKLLQK